MKRGERMRVGMLVWLVLLLLSGAVAGVAGATTGRGVDVTAPSLTWGGCWYVVRPGDNLFRIAARHGVSYWYLAQINGLHNPNYIYAGQMLIVPCGNVPPPYPPQPKPCAPSQTYVVKPQDNLFRIALNHGTTINALRNANHLWGRVLRPGMTLVIPCPGSVQYGNQTPVPPISGETPVPPPPTAIPPPTTVPPPTSDGNLVEPSATVTLQNSQVNPNPVEIKAGQAVLWINNDQKTYTLLSGIPGQPNEVFASPPIPSGGTFVFKFDAAGNYSYYVNEDPTMVGQVNVTP
ncbi:MAG: LysM peptidoglycan-binding domain-containing protein [Chloroflexi bacterium]|nr:LysM peptidoglycan-binding domain-containing protein [Chloroflexota bacterium]